MKFEPITLERLTNFGEILKEYDTLKRHKRLLMEKIGTIKGIDYSKDRVQAGNGLRTSEEERYAMKLENINEKIKEYEAWINPEKEIIKNQIARVKKRDYRKILIFRYIERWKWSEIIQEFFELEQDYEEEKQGKYRDTMMYWNRRAVAELEKISSQPYIEVKQLSFN